MKTVMQNTQDVVGMGATVSVLVLTAPFSDDASSVTSVWFKPTEFTDLSYLLFIVWEFICQACNDFVFRAAIKS